MPEPVVSVVMAVHNGQEYLSDAVDSVLNQTFEDFEFIVVDDGSTDGSLAIMRAFARKDSRIRLLENENNLGLASSLNKGVGLARGRYIARMDGDDISLARRLEKQLRFLEGNVDVSMCGSWARFIGYRSKLQRYPTAHDEINASLLFFTPIFHPSVMFRRSAIDRLDYLYEDGRKRVEDLELWARLTRQMKVANVPECLLHYRVYKPGNVAKRKSVVAHGNLIRKSLLRDLLGEITEEQFCLHMQVAHCERNQSLAFMNEAADWLEYLLAANAQKQCFEPEALARVVSERWWRVCKSSTELGPVAFNKFRSRPALCGYNPGPVRTAVWFCKSLIHYRNANHSIHDEELAFVSQLPETLTE